MERWRKCEPCREQDQCHQDRKQQVQKEAGGNGSHAQDTRRSQESRRTVSEEENGWRRNWGSLKDLQVS